MTRRLGCLLPLLMLAMAAPVAAHHVDWRPDPVSRLAALDADLQPVMAHLTAAQAALTAWNATPWELDSLPENAAEWQAAVLDFQSVAVEGLAVLDQYPPEPCFADYWAILRVGFLKLGDSVAEFPNAGGDIALAMSLLYSEPLPGYPPAYADLVHSVTHCGGSS